jgi:hypothetical protein
MADKKKRKKRKKKTDQYSEYEFRQLMGEFDQKLGRHKGALRRK